MPKRTYTRAYASLRLFSDDVDPVEITNLLQLPPEHTHRKGELRLTRTKKGKVSQAAPYQRNVWRMSSKDYVRSSRVQTHIEWILSEIAPRQRELSVLFERGVRGDIFCFSSGKTTEPPSYPHALQEQAKGLGLNIVVDHYLEST